MYSIGRSIRRAKAMPILSHHITLRALSSSHPLNKYETFASKLVRWEEQKKSKELEAYEEIDDLIGTRGACASVNL